MFRFVIILFSAVFLSACVSVAKVSDFPTSNSDIDFATLSEKSFDEDSVGFYTTEFEDFVRVSPVSEEALYQAIEESLREVGYTVKQSNREKGVVIGKNASVGMTEYASVTGVYVKPQQGAFQVYVRTKLTHSITPGWASKYDVAKAVTGKLCENLETCDQ
ncbi:hypothetical protein [Kistimonas asteriae]|uniref:hypothetical protein n=1 Tax=Kistimonas asteriae TaxID=517724 RepID=UPI001BA5D892|nr:hypothetical protein [Kistimonas asteriae]